MTINFYFDSWMFPVRFGVIHAVFTNLLLWCSGVMSEANHLLNHHNTRLTALGFENLTMGKGTRVEWLLEKRTIVHLRSSLNWMKDGGLKGRGWIRQSSRSCLY